MRKENSTFNVYAELRKRVALVGGPTCDPSLEYKMRDQFNNLKID